MTISAVMRPEERRTDAYGQQLPVWDIDLPSRRLVWDKFYTGPLLLTDDEIAGAADRLLGAAADELPALCDAELECFVSGDGEPPPALLLHSATGTTKGFEGDLDDLLRGAEPWDVPAYLETRVVFLARPGDLAVGRTSPWRDAVGHAGVEHVDIDDRDHYYLSHALISLALRHTERPVPALERIVAWLRERPESVVRLYALDREMQVFLLWLRRATGLSRLRVDANNAVIANTWNAKGPLHPTVAAAERLAGEASRLGPYELLALEQRHSALHTELGVVVHPLPGYTVPRRGRDRASFVADAVRAAELLVARYRLDRGCLKPAEAGDGARIVADVDLADVATLSAAADDAYQHGDDYLLEAQVRCRTFAVDGVAGVDGAEFAVAPSAHIRFGHVADGLTMQLMHGRSWQGNVYFDDDSCTDVAVTPDEYRMMRADIEALRAGFTSDGSKADGSYGGLVTGGVDFLVGSVGGVFGADVLTGMTDLNLSSHGAEYLRAFLDRMAGERSAGRATADRYAASHVFRPTGAATHGRLLRAIGDDDARAGRMTTVVAAVPERWAMVVTSGSRPREAASQVMGLLDRLRRLGLAH